MWAAIVAAVVTMAVGACPVADPGTPLDLDALTRLVLAENRRPDPTEARGIVSSVLNRMDLEGFPSDLLGVLTQKRQYSPFTPGDPNYPIATGAGPHTPGWDRVRPLVQAALTQPRLPYTHYWASRITPEWSKGLPQVAHGLHTFATEPRKRKARSEPAPVRPLEAPRTLTDIAVSIPRWAIPGGGGSED